MAVRYTSSRVVKVLRLLEFIYMFERYISICLNELIINQHLFLVERIRHEDIPQYSLYSVCLITVVLFYECFSCSIQRCE